MGLWRAAILLGPWKMTCQLGLHPRTGRVPSPSQCWSPGHGWIWDESGLPQSLYPLVLKARAVLLLPIPHFRESQRGISSSPGFTPAAFITIIFIYSSMFHPIPITISKTAAKGVCSREFKAQCGSSSSAPLMLDAPLPPQGALPAAHGNARRTPNPGKALEHSWMWKMLGLSLFTHAGAAPRPDTAQHWAALVLEKP